MCDTTPLQGYQGNRGSQVRQITPYEDSPILIAAIDAKLLLQMPLQVSLDTIVVQQCVINVD